MELKVRKAQTKVVDIWLADEVLNAVWAVASKFRFRLASKAPNVCLGTDWFPKPLCFVPFSLLVCSSFGAIWNCQQVK